MCKKPCEFFNMEEVTMETIMERRGPSLDDLVNGERVVLATKWWWSVAKNGGSEEISDAMGVDISERIAHFTTLYVPEDSPGADGLSGPSRFRYPLPDVCPWVER